jgi:hypothetical protein
MSHSIYVFSAASCAGLPRSQAFLAPGSAPNSRLPLIGELPESGPALSRLRCSPGTSPPPRSFPVAERGTEWAPAVQPRRPAAAAHGGLSRSPWAFEWRGELARPRSNPGTLEPVPHDLSLEMNMSATLSPKPASPVTIMVSITIVSGGPKMDKKQGSAPAPAFQIVQLSGDETRRRSPSAAGN